LPGLAHIGWSNQLGCSEGFHLLVVVCIGQQFFGHLRAKN
jgi:hypothetical protein